MKLRIPYFLDLVTGAARMRALSIFLFVFIVIVSIFSILYSMFAVVKDKYIDIEFHQTPPASIAISKPFPPFNISVIDENGEAISNLSVNVAALPFGITPLTTTLNEDDFLELREVDCLQWLTQPPTAFFHEDSVLCQVEILNGEVRTGADGVAVFDGLLIQNALPQDIVLYFSVELENVTYTIEHPMSLNSAVSRIDILQLSDTLQQAAASYPEALPIGAGDAFDLSLNVTLSGAFLTDNIQNYVGVAVHLLSLPIDGRHYLSNVYTHSTHGPKLTMFAEGHYSLQSCSYTSSSETVAVCSADLKGIRIVGSSENRVGIMVEVLGITQVVYYDGRAQQASSSTFRIPALPAYDPTFLLSSGVSRLEVRVNPPISVVEGELLREPPIVCALDANGNGIAGKYMFARITSRLGLPHAGFENRVYLDIKHRRLTSPVVGPTDADGCVTFTDLRFTRHGPVGEYGISFLCDGVQSTQEWKTNVNSAIASVELVMSAILDPSVASTTNSNGEVEVFVTKDWEVMPSLRVLDKHGVPLQGKSVAVVAETGATSHGIPELYIDAEVIPSDRDGWIYFSWVTVLYSSKEGVFNVTLSLDNNLWHEFTIKVSRLNETESNECQAVMPVKYPQRITIGDFLHNTNQEFEMLTVNEFGDPLPFVWGTITIWPWWGDNPPVYLNELQFDDQYAYYLYAADYESDRYSSFQDVEFQADDTGLADLSFLHFAAGYSTIAPMSASCTGRYGPLMDIEVFQQVGGLQLEYLPGVYYPADPYGSEEDGYMGPRRPGILVTDHNGQPLPGVTVTTHVNLKPKYIVDTFEFWTEESVVSAPDVDTNEDGIAALNIAFDPDFSPGDCMPGYYGITVSARGVYGNIWIQLKLLETFTGIDIVLPVVGEEFRTEPLLVDPWEPLPTGELRILQPSHDEVRQSVGPTVFDTGEERNTWYCTDRRHRVELRVQACGPVSDENPCPADGNNFKFVDFVLRTPDLANGMLVRDTEDVYDEWVADTYQRADTEIAYADGTVIVENLVLLGGRPDHHYRIVYTLGGEDSSIVAIEPGIFTLSEALTAVLKAPPSLIATPGVPMQRSAQVQVYASSDYGEDNPLYSLGVVLLVDEDVVPASLDTAGAYWSDVSKNNLVTFDGLAFTKSTAAGRYKLVYQMAGVRTDFSPAISVTRSPHTIDWVPYWDIVGKPLVNGGAFVVKMIARVADGSPLPNTMITCKLEIQGTTVTALHNAQHIDEFETYRGCFGPQCGVLKQGTEVAWTNSDGEATIKTLVQSAYPGQYKLGCQAQDGSSGLLGSVPVGSIASGARLDQLKQVRSFEDLSSYTLSVLKPAGRNALQTIVDKGQDLIDDVFNFLTLGSSLVNQIPGNVEKQLYIQTEEFTVYNNVQQVIIDTQPELDIKIVPNPLTFTVLTKAKREKKFTQQPVLRILDRNNNPLPAKSVQIFGFPQDARLKFTYDKSGRSDKDGYYRFEDLSIVGGAEGDFQLLFFVDGIPSEPSDQLHILWSAQMKTMDQLKVTIACGVALGIPVFAANYPYNSLAWLIVGLIFLVGYGVFTWFMFAVRVFDANNTFIIIMFILLVASYVVLCVLYIALIICCIIAHKKPLSNVGKFITNRHRAEDGFNYVKWLINVRDQEPVEFLWHRPNDHIIHKPPDGVKGFRYSTRFLFALGVCAYLLLAAIAYTVWVWLELKLWLEEARNRIPRPPFEFAYNDITNFNDYIVDSLEGALRELSSRNHNFLFTLKILNYLKAVDWYVWWNEASIILDEMVTSMNVSGIVAATCALLAIACNWIFLVTNYKKFAMRLAKGKLRDEELKGNFTAAEFYPGFQILHFVFAYFIVFFIVFFITLLLSTPTFIKWVFRTFWLVILISLIPIVIRQFIVQILVRRIILIPKWEMRWPRVYHIWGVISLILGLVGAIMGSLVRFFFAIAVMAVYFARLDRAIFPRGILAMLDASHGSYVAMHIVDFYHNNPIRLVFLAYLLKDWDNLDYAGLTPTVRNMIDVIRDFEAEKNANSNNQQQKCKGEEDRYEQGVKPKRTAAQKRWQLAAYLVLNPSLIRYRKAAWKAKKEQEADNKGQQSPKGSETGYNPTIVEAVFDPVNKPEKSPMDRVAPIQQSNGVHSNGIIDEETQQAPPQNGHADIPGTAHTEVSTATQTYPAGIVPANNITNGSEPKAYNTKATIPTPADFRQPTSQLRQRRTDPVPDTEGETHAKGAPNYAAVWTNPLDPSPVPPYPYQQHQTASPHGTVVRVVPDPHYRGYV